MAISIPQTKSEVIMNVSSTTAGVTANEVLLDDDGISFVVFMEDVPDTSALVIELYEARGGKAYGTPIYTTPVLSGTSTSRRFGFVTGSNVIVKASYSGEAAFLVLGKGVSAAEVNHINKQTAGAIAGPGVEGSIIASSTPREICVGDTALEGRVLVIAYNNSNDTMYWGRTPGLTASTGIPLFKGQMATWSFTDTAKLYVIAPANGGGALVVTESKMYGQ